MDILDGAHVQAPGGLHGDQQLRVLVDLPGDDGLLLVAAGHAAGHCDRPLAGADVVLLDQAVGVLADGLALQEARLADELRLKVPLEHHVVLQGVVQHQAVLVAVLRDVAHAQQRPLPDGGAGDVLAAERNLAGLQGLQARQAVDQLRLAVAVNTGNADNLSRPDRKGDILHSIVVMELGGHSHTLHHQDGILGLGGLLVDCELHVPAHHHAGQLFTAGLGDVHRADVFALPQDRAAVRHGHDLIQLVGDEQDGFALCRQVLHDLHQLVDLLRRQHSGGLVEDQDLIVPVEHLQDLRALLHAHGDILHQRVRVHLQAVLLRQGQDLLPGLLLLQEAVLAGFHAQDDVV